MILLDTHVLLWIRLGSPRVGPQTRRRVENALPVREVAISAVSFWEIAMLVRRGRLAVHLDPAAWRRQLLDEGLVELPVDGELATRAGSLTDLHGDPADRIIVATALSGHQLMTADRRILEWPGELDRLDARA